MSLKNSLSNKLLRPNYINDWIGYDLLFVAQIIVILTNLSMIARLPHLPNMYQIHLLPEKFYLPVFFFLCVNDPQFT